MNKNWFEHWFSSEDYLDVYEHRDDEDSENIVKLILDNIDINEGAKVLDAACGAGRHSIIFAKKGFNVHGFDLSQTLLKVARKQAYEQKLNIIFQDADKRYFRTNIKFDLIVSLFTSFGYFDSDKENFTFPRNAYHMLNENGYYVLDYLNKTFLENNLVEFSKKSIQNKEIIENRMISDGRVIKKITIKSKNNNSEFTESVRLYTYEEIVCKFKEIGYTIHKVFGDYFGNNYDSESSERCIIIFKK